MALSPGEKEGSSSSKDGVLRSVRVSYTAEDDAAYLALPGSEELTFPRQIVVEADDIPAMIVLDFTADGKLGGIEVIGASAVLDNSFLSD